MSEEALNQDELCVLAVISNIRGLHARAAARFVKAAEAFTAEITVSKDGMSVSARSIMGLMMLSATQGSTIRISARGDDAPTALEEMSNLVKRKFDEE